MAPKVISPEKLRDYCRICMSKRGMVNIFKARSILQMLRLFSPIKLLEEDGLPDSLCNLCLKTLRSSYKFWNQCKESHSILCEIFKVEDLSITADSIKKEEDNVETVIKEELESDISNIEVNDLLNMHLENIEFCDTSQHKADELTITSKQPDYNKPIIKNILKKITSLKDLKVKPVIIKESFKKKRITKTENTEKKTVTRKRNKNNLTKNEENDIDHEINEPIVSLETPDKDFIIANKRERDLSPESPEPTKVSGLTCCFCEIEYSDNNEYNKHMDAHKKETEVCTVCRKVVVGRYNIMRHQGIHELYPCETCGKVLTKYYLRKHVRNMHSEFNKPCPICGNVFSSYEYYRKHVERHTKKPQYPCTLCDKICASKLSLLNHTYTHTDTKPHKCSFCEKTFTILKSKKQHECQHTGVRPLGCPLCEKTFIQRCNLKSHFVHNHKDCNYNEYRKKIRKLVKGY